MAFWHARHPIGPPAVGPVTPPPADIRDTIADSRSRAILATYCLTWADCLEFVPTLGQYHEARKIADRTLQAASKLPPGLDKFDAALSARLTAAVGLDPSREDLEPAAAVFRKTAGDLQ